MATTVQQTEYTYTVPPTTINTMSDDSSTMSDDSSDDDGAREMALETADYVAAPFEPYSWAALVGIPYRAYRQEDGVL
jgi:hypothetical protein